MPTCNSNEFLFSLRKRIAHFLVLRHAATTGFETKPTPVPKRFTPRALSQPATYVLSHMHLLNFHRLPFVASPRRRPHPRPFSASPSPSTVLPCETRAYFNEIWPAIIYKAKNVMFNINQWQKLKMYMSIYKTVEEKRGGEVREERGRGNEFNNVWNGIVIVYIWLCVRARMDAVELGLCVCVCRWAPFQQSTRRRPWPLTVIVLLRVLAHTRPHQHIQTRSLARFWVVKCFPMPRPLTLLLHQFPVSFVVCLCI